MTHNGVDMDSGAVDQWEAGGLLIEHQRQIGPSQHDGLDPLFCEEALAGRTKDSSLRFGNNTGDRHRHVSLVDVVEVLTHRRNDCCGGKASIKTRLHHSPCAQNSNPSEAAFGYGPIDLDDHVDGGKGRFDPERLHAEMPGNRGNGNAGRACCGEPAGQSGEYCGLRGLVIASEVFEQCGSVSMGDREFQRRFPVRKRTD